MMDLKGMKHDVQPSAQMSWEALRFATDILSSRGIRGTLVGTSGLWAHGYDVWPGDIDFLVDQSFDPRSLKNDAGSVPGSIKIWFEIQIGGKVHLYSVDYILVDEQRKLYFNKPEIIQGIPVATLQDILGLKKFAGRWEDREFLMAWDAGDFKKR